MGSKPPRRCRASIASIPSLRFTLAGCGGVSGSRLSTAAPPVTAYGGDNNIHQCGARHGRDGERRHCDRGASFDHQRHSRRPCHTPPTTVSPLPPPSRSSTPPPPAPRGQRADGYITAGPTCPVERPDQPCQPRPVAAHVRGPALLRSHCRCHRQPHRRPLPPRLRPGTHTLTATTGTAWPHCQPTQVIVHAGSPTRADITCDTGIR